MALKDLQGLLLLLFFALLTAFSYNYFSPFGIALFGQWEKTNGVVNAVSKTNSVNSLIEINNSEYEIE